MLPKCLINYPTCDRCGQAMELVESTPEGFEIYACGWCDLGGKEHSHIEYLREFCCWSCGKYQKVGEVRRSITPRMGHYCIYCNKDLEGWFDLIGRRINTYA